MIEYFRTDDNGTLLKLGQEEPGCWIALFDPDVKELADIATRFTVDLDDLRAPLDREEISRIEREDSYTMFIVDTPIHDESLGEHGYTTIPLGIIQTPTNVISVCSVLRIKVISRLKSRRDLHPTTDIPGFTSDLLISSSGAYASMLRALNKRRIALAAVDQNPSRRNLEELYTLDAGHFHPTEVISAKISALMQFMPRILLHVSRGVRWDSDHVITLDDELMNIMTEVIRGGYEQRVNIALDYFDASINRIAAWVIGTRNARKALLRACLEPTEALKKAEAEGDYTTRLALTEEFRTLPFSAVWDYFCAQQNVPVGEAWLGEVKAYEAKNQR